MTKKKKKRQTGRQKDREKNRYKKDRQEGQKKGRKEQGKEQRNRDRKKDKTKRHKVLMKDTQVCLLGLGKNRTEMEEETLRTGWFASCAGISDCTERSSCIGESTM